MKKILNKILINIVCAFIPHKQFRKKIRKAIVSSNNKNIIKKREELYNKLINKVKNKDKIKVAFFVLHESVWQYDGVYKLMLKDEKFDPIIVVIPYNLYGKDYMINDMDKTYQYFKNNKYNVMKAYNKQQDKYLNLRKCFNPDIIFFTNPHYLTEDIYYIDYWHDKALTLYVPYSMTVASLEDIHYNSDFQNFVWKKFYESSLHLIMAKNYNSNIIVTGYPKCDIFLDKSYKPNDVWKKQNSIKKKIIWAPHHSIEDNGLLDYSDFLINADFILEMADKYQDKVQFSFKPHPLLKIKLYNHKDWGKNKTDEYYKVWKEKSNCQLNITDYIDLFLTSDAIINSSGSFVAEYLFMQKPSLFFIKSDKTKDQFNEFGNKCLLNWYQANTYSELESFIENQVLKNIDYKKEERADFIQKYLIPPNSKTASENIYEYIKQELNK